jgi:hypothetical protein
MTISQGQRTKGKNGKPSCDAVEAECLEFCWKQALTRDTFPSVGFIPQRASIEEVKDESAENRDTDSYRNGAFCLDFAVVAAISESQGARALRRRRGEKESREFYPIRCIHTWDTTSLEYNDKKG